MDNIKYGAKDQRFLDELSSTGNRHIIKYLRYHMERTLEQRYHK